MNLSKNTLAIINCAVLSLIIVFLIYKESLGGNEVVYLDSQKLFDNFNMTKEMKRLGEAQFQDRQQRIDSFFVSVKSANGVIRETAMQNYIKEKESLERFDDEYAEEASAKVWNRIESYASDFANSKGYKLILTTQTRSNLLFGAVEKNVTNEFLTYINKRYEGQGN